MIDMSASVALNHHLINHLSDVIKVKSESTIVDIQTDYLQKYIR